MMETLTQSAIQRADWIQSDTVPRHDTSNTSSDRQQHYLHEYHWPPQHQYKSNNWTIAIILKLTLVVWDSWTYQIGF